MEDGVAAVGGGEGVGKVMEERVVEVRTDGNGLSMPVVAAIVAESVGREIVMGGGQGGEVEGVDGVTGLGIVDSYRGPHGVAGVPKAVEP